MAARHKKRASGGPAILKAGGNPNVLEEAEEKKKGGKVVGKMHGKASAKRLDRPGRKRGGRVGANMSPLSTAHNVSSPPEKPRAKSSQ